MKKNKIIIVAIIAVMVLTFTACGGNKNLEQYAKGTDVAARLEADIDGMSASIKGNDVILSYDVSCIGIDTESSNQKVLNASLQDALEQNAEMYEEQVQSLEKESEIKGVKLTVRYTLGDEVLAEETYTSSNY